MGVYASRIMPRVLPLYLRQERRRAGLSQADVAYLFGARAKTNVSRYERGKHLPALQTALAYEAILGVPVAQLFPRAFADVRRAVIRRAKRRSEILTTLPESPRNLRRQRSLRRLIGSP
jgi:transcriptional regulator with XRE-family HTH domain